MISDYLPIIYFTLGVLALPFVILMFDSTIEERLEDEERNVKIKNVKFDELEVLTFQNKIDVALQRETTALEVTEIVCSSMLSHSKLLEDWKVSPGNYLTRVMVRIDFITK